MRGSQGDSQDMMVAGAQTQEVEASDRIGVSSQVLLQLQGSQWMLYFKEGCVMVSPSRGMLR